MTGTKRSRSDAESKMTVAENFIGGKMVPPSTGEYMDVIAPADGSVCAKVAVSGAADVQRAVDAAREAFKTWGSMTVKRRVQSLIQFNVLVKKHADELADLIVLEHGKNKMEALGDIHKGNETVEYAISMPQLVQGKFLEVSGGVTCKDTRRPLGVVTSIVPFNFPGMVPLWTLPIAIATGNCIIVKPSEKVPLTFRRLALLMQEAGIPDGVVNIINGTRVAVEALIDNKGVDGVTFVGSTKVAEIVSKRARNLNKRVLALGGAKNHLVCMPDCDIEMAAQDIVNSFSGCTGQRCMAASVLLTVGPQEKLLNRVVEIAAALKPGKEARNLGPVIDQASLDRINRYIGDAEKGGAKLLLDGRSWSKDNPKGFWAGPTVILHSNENDAALKDEIFGPVLSVLEVKSPDEAIRIENGNPYGNAAAVYTTSGANAEWFTKRFSAGMLGVNIGVPVPREPFSFGGINASKFGDFDITADGGMEFFTRRIKITTKWSLPKNRTWMD